MRSAYRDLALRYHPDRNKSPAAQEKFKDISEAYARALELLNDQDAEPETDTTPHYDSEEEERSTLVLREGNQPLIELKDGARGNLMFALELSLEEVARGSRKTILATEKSVCQFCNGKGTKCVHCNETGIHEDVHEIPLRIPPGAEEGMQLRLTDSGDFGGDVFVELSIKPHPVFQRDEEANVYRDLQVTPNELRNGREFRIRVPDGSTVSLRVPPSTARGTIFVVQGRGLPKWGTSTKGDLMVKIV